MKWTRLDLEVDTPIFNQGVSPVDDDPALPGHPVQRVGPELRVPSILGATRYWLRALTSGLLDDAQIPALERRVLGGISGDSGLPSPLQFKVSKQPEVCFGGGIGALVQSGPTTGLAYLCGQGLYDSKGRCLTRGFIPTHTNGGVRNSAVLEFRLRDASREAEAQLALNALWLALCVGGIGARTRRGFGGLKVVDCNGNLPTWVRDSWVCTRPGDLNEASGTGSFTFDAYARQVPELVEMIMGRELLRSRSSDQPSTFPTIGVRGLSFVHASSTSYRTWNAAASVVGTRFREFRACNSVGGRRNTPEWVSVVRGTSTDFPLGLFGLPVNFQDKLTRQTYQVNLFDKHKQGTRRASPIWFRYISSPIDRSKFITLTFAFANRFTDDQHEARLVEVRKNAPDTELKEATPEPMDLKPMFDAWCQFLDDPTLTNPGRPEP